MPLRAQSKKCKSKGYIVSHIQEVQVKGLVSHIQEGAVSFILLYPIALHFSVQFPELRCTSHVHTDLQDKANARLREPGGQDAGFTQPSLSLLLQVRTFALPFR